MSKEVNDINSFFDFLNNKGISFSKDHRCKGADQNSHITDLLYLNNKKEICGFEFRNEYDKIDLYELLQLPGNLYNDSIHLILQAFFQLIAFQLV